MSQIDIHSDDDEGKGLCCIRWLFGEPRRLRFRIGFFVLFQLLKAACIRFGI